MANARIKMFLLRRLIELRLQNTSKRNLARILAISRNTVQHYLDQLEALVPDLSQLLTWDDAQLDRLINPPIPLPARHQQLMDLFPTYERELARPGVTRQQLWIEYRQQAPDGLRYSHFNHLFRQWQKAQKGVMHLDHKAGEQLFIDFAGDPLYLTDAKTGQKRPVEVFVAILPCSQLTFVRAIASQQQDDFLDVLQACLVFIGGVTQAIVPDNLKAAVTKADRYEPTINQAFQEFAAHFQTIIYPARARKPRDKALVEGAVRLIYQRVYAPLRDRTFYDLTALNAAIGPLLDGHNTALFQGGQQSRQTRFEQLEKVHLRPLPVGIYERKQYCMARVQVNGHAQLRADKHFYSVPYGLIGQSVKFIYTSQTVEIYHHYERVAVHQRVLTTGQYTTLREHLHPHHQWVSGHSPLFFQEKADQIGPFTRQLIDHLLASCSYPPQAYRSCAGILSLQKGYGSQRLERACQRALAYQATAYRFVKTMLEREMDRLELVDDSASQSTLPLLTHENIRGASQYQ